MKDIIHLLPDSLANQIAAGEVVQRPASVIKELMENSIDAESSEIKLYIKDSGKTLIQVVDNGIGMSETDLRLSIERHTTSKIVNSEDIYNISTLGFRGEALASICAVAQMDIKSKLGDEEMGSHLILEGSKIILQELVSMSKGTAIVVKNLFFNVPARRKFLKSDIVETKHIIETFQRVALANPDIEMSFYQDEELVYKLVKSNLGKRIMSIFGNNYRNNLLPCSEKVQQIHIKGYIGKPEIARKTRGGQFFFVNNRFIKHAYLHHAVMDAYSDLLPEDKHPFYTIFITMPPSDIDINIHPTKMEIKFEDERTIYAIIQAMLKRSLSSQGITPPMNFSVDTNILRNDFESPLSDSKTSKSSSYPSYQPQESYNTRSQKDWQKLYEDSSSLKENLEDQKIPLPNDEEDSHIILKSKMDNLSQKESFQPLSLENTKPKVIYVHNTFALYQIKSGLMVVDQVAALERIFYDRFLKKLNNQNKKPQQMIFPKKLYLNPIDTTLLGDFKDELKKMGFIIDILNSKEIVIKAIPSELNGSDEKELIEELIEQIKMNKPLNFNIGQRFANFLSKRTAKQKHKLTDEFEIDKLIDLLFQSSNPYYTSEGKKILSLLGIETLKNWFKKS